MHTACMQVEHTTWSQHCTLNFDLLAHICQLVMVGATYSTQGVEQHVKSDGSLSSFCFYWALSRLWLSHVTHLSLLRWLWVRAASESQKRPQWLVYCTVSPDTLTFQGIFGILRLNMLISCLANITTTTETPVTTLYFLWLLHNKKAFWLK